MDRLDKQTMTMLIVVFLSISLVVAGAFFLIYLFSPSEEPAENSFGGIMLYEDGTSEPTTLKIAGTIVSYPFEVKPTSFKTNVYSNRQGLTIGDRRLIPSVFLGWYNEESSIVCQVRNGLRFYTDRDFSFLLVIMPDGKDHDKVAFGPVSDEAAAREGISALCQDPYFSRKWPDIVKVLDKFTH